MGQQKIYEHEALGDGAGRRLHCRLTSFSRSLQIILRINLDGTRWQETRPQCLRPHPRGMRGEAEGADQGDEGRDCGSEAADGRRKR